MERCFGVTVDVIRRETQRFRLNVCCRDRSLTAMGRLRTIAHEKLLQLRLERWPVSRTLKY